MNRIFLQHANKGISITWDDNDFDLFISNLYKPWQTGTTSISESIEVTKADGRYFVVKGDHTLIRDSFEGTLINIELLITDYFQSLMHQYLQIHACTLSHKGRAVAIVGDHGTGKTTLACAGIQTGMKALADDVTVISDDCKTVLGFPRPFKITQDTWDMKPSVIPDDCPSIRTNGYTYLFYHEPMGKYYCQETKLEHIVFMTRRLGATTFLKIGETDALRRLLPQGFNFYRRNDSLLEDLHILFNNAPPIEMLYSNHIDAVNEIHNLLE